MAKKAPYLQKVVIVGCGNVAWHLASHLSALKRFRLEVYNHKPSERLAAFKNLPGCKTIAGIGKISGDADFYVVAVSDSHIASVSNHIRIKKSSALIMHTSGSTELAALGDRAHHSAVFYPLQTFSSAVKVNWSEIPVIVEADNGAVRKQAADFASNFTREVQFASYHERLRIHVAAVLVNNFTNVLYAQALQLLNEKSDTPFSVRLLLPLIKQTVAKLETLSPEEAQTGPARRGDSETIHKHLKVLKKKDELRKLYRQFTKLIKKQYA